MPNHIPPITDPMGSGWDQPSRSDIDFINGRAVMTKATFDKLPEYSASLPSGVYEGKMWKRLDGRHDPTARKEDIRWLLMWYGPSKKPDQCSINHLPITIKLATWRLQEKVTANG